jgi:beta-galactosidase/beta-glucuronidase
LGGGIFEEEAFYDTCDEMGVLVWQDFLFGCGNYPAYPEFLDLVKREATANVKLLRHHPSIVIWAGNNEDYQYQESEHLDYDPHDKDPQSWLKSSFPQGTSMRRYWSTLRKSSYQAHTTTLDHRGVVWIPEIPQLEIFINGTVWYCDFALQDYVC